MYIFPTLDFDPAQYHKLYSRAKNSNLQIDDIYCIELLEGTGICCVLVMDLVRNQILII